ncbi:MAG: hypothetical protein K0B15_01825 [Lentimicrobium sp.]|nr:hypothetical protein [Lentimicrobium sp.]
METNSNSQIPDLSTPVKRPTSLSLLCILTFIGSGISLISSVFVFAAFDIIPLAIEEVKMPEAEQMLELIIAAGRPFFAYMAILYAISLVGAIMIWKLRKTGFHLYTTSQLLMLILPSVIIDNYQLPWTSILLTASFIMAYGLNLKFMK